MQRANLVFRAKQYPSTAIHLCTCICPIYNHQQPPLLNHYDKTHQSLKLKMTIDIHNMLREVDIATNPLVLKVGKLCPEHRDVTTTLDGEVDTVGSLGEVVTKPFKVA